MASFSRLALGCVQRTAAPRALIAKHYHRRAPSRSQAGVRSIVAPDRADLVTFPMSATIGTNKTPGSVLGWGCTVSNGSVHLVDAVHHQPELEAHENNEDHDRRDERR